RPLGSTMPVPWGKEVCAKEGGVDLLIASRRCAAGAVGLPPARSATSAKAGSVESDGFHHSTSCCSAAPSKQGATGRASSCSAASVQSSTAMTKRVRVMLREDDQLV